MIRPFRTDADIKSLSDQTIKSIATNIQEKGCAVFYNQSLSPEEYIQTMSRFGEMEKPDLFMNPKEFPEIFLVTGERDDKGNKIGMFGDGELGWHSNGNSRHNNDKILIGLYCVKGDVNTTLSICHTGKPFWDLSEEEREYYRSIKIKIKFKNNTMYDLEEGDPELEFMSASRGSIRKLVGRHPHTDEEYFYFPYHFIEEAWAGREKININKLKEDLKPIIFQSKYQHHHVFQEGDLVLMDQFTSLHRRSPVMGPRMLWRIASDYNNAMA